MFNSVLLSIKQSIGVHPEDTSFDGQIAMHINTVLVILNELGVTEVVGKRVEDQLMDWEELLNGRTDIENVKTYIAHRVKMMFDPPTSSAAMEAIQRTINELEWRICN